MVRQMTPKHLAAINRGRKAAGLKPIRMKKTETKKKTKRISKDKIDLICQRCKTKYKPDDNYCRKCGRLRKRSDIKRQMTMMKKPPPSERYSDENRLQY